MTIRSIARAAALLLVLSAIQSPAVEEKGPSEREFCRLDANSDRQITYDEFAACEFHRLEHVKQLPFSDPELFGKSPGKQFSETDLKHYLFKKADRNRNSKIDRKEWEEFYNSLIDRHENRTNSSP